MASFLHDRAIVGIYTWHTDCVYRQWFLEVFLGPFINVNDRIMLMSDAVLSEGLKTTCIQQRSSALSLKHRDFSSFSETFDDVMQIMRFAKPLQFDAEEHCFCKYSTIFLRTLSQNGSLRHPFHVTDLMSINLISC